MSCLLHNFSASFTLTLTAICCISGFLAAVANTVVLLSLRKINSLRATARYFMGSLAAAELFSGVAANSFYSSWLILDYLRHGTNVLWQTETAVWVFTTTCITYNLVNVALDRYIAMTSPLQYYTRMNSTRCLMLIAFAWSLAFCSASFAYVVPEKHLPKLWISGTITAVIIPFCIIAFCYFNIYRATRRTFPLREHITNAEEIAEHQRRKKTAYTFGIITGLFIVLFAPSFIFNGIHLFDSSLGPPVALNESELCENSVREVWMCIAVVSYLSAIFDPWIYAIRMPDFRVALKELFQSSCRRLMQRKSKNRCQAREEQANRDEDLQGMDSVYNNEIFDTAL